MAGRWSRLLGTVALLLVGLVLGGCGGGGPTAPNVAALDTVCGGNFCVDYPASWELVEQTSEFVSLRHPASPEEIVATIGQVNMEGVVNADGKQWPQTPDAVVRSFWALIDGGSAELATISPLRDGSVESFGTFAGGRLWYRLTPLQGRSAVGIEVRGPNSTWAEHAETIMDSVVVADP